MLSLFSTRSSEAGFRLHALEIFNWGTFDSVIWRIEPGGENTLLTGANSSGKTTLVDGLQTLLVPERRMRFYNQTAGAKGERNEESYVMGEYGEAENEETQLREIRKLRPDKSKAHSILLGVFQNEDQFVSLVQCRWFTDSGLKSTFILAHKQLSIEEDFGEFGSNGEWRKTLKQKYPKQGGTDVLHFFDQPGEYARHLRHVFGMRKNAHQLFSQTIGLKVLGNLDEFVRTKMLEETNSEAEFQQVKEHFKKLSDAHRAIERTTEQIRLLEPVRDTHRQLLMLQADLLSLEEDKKMLPLWFGRRLKSLTDSYVDAKLQEQELLIEREQTAQQQLDELNDKERSLDLLIRNDEAGKEIAELEKAVKGLLSKKSEREKELAEYNKLAKDLGLVENPSELVFLEQRATALAMQKDAKAELTMLEGERDKLVIEKDKMEKEIDAIINELRVLRSQKNNITGRVAEIRGELLAAVGAKEDEIPFIGELMRVVEHERAWEPAIEQLLHNLGLGLLVPDKYYSQVTRYINDNDLQGRISYHRYQIMQTLNFLMPESNRLFHKLEFKPSHYRDWLEVEIRKNYDYVCTDDLEEFRRCDKALTSNRQIKNRSRHDKDDRKRVLERQRYVLGWDNKAKIAALKAEGVTLEKELKIKTDALRSLSCKQLKLHSQVENSGLLIRYTSYEKLDWKATALQIQEVQDRIKVLQNSNNKIKDLGKQREGVMANIKFFAASLKKLREELFQLKESIRQKKQQLSYSLELIGEIVTEPDPEKVSRFEENWIKDLVIIIEDLLKEQERVKFKLDKRVEAKSEEVRATKSQLEGRMRNFISPSDSSLTQKFPDWRNDTYKLTEKADYASDFLELLDRLEKHELVEQREKFKKYLNEEMITKMSDFKGWLDRQVEDIEEHIERLNVSLQSIRYRKNPDTFIQLHVNKVTLPKIKDLRIKLNDWKPNVAEYHRTQDDSILEASFLKIQKLLDDLTNDENYRKEVLDVRNWLQFKAVEHFAEDPKKTDRSYTGTAKLSGGEGAQLTYTILGSAIAYQFGIHSEGLSPRSFRFICVDEAFSKQDDEKAHYLMELCKQLHLQLMVVSPAKAEEVAIVEPYIAKIHFVQRIDNRTSAVHDMSILQLQEFRETLLEEVAVST